MIGKQLSHYLIEEKLGEGGMGAVYLAEDLKLHRKVAIKVLRERLTQDEDRKRRFIREAHAAAAIDHPHIAAVFDIDEVDGRTFIAMEYVREKSLRDAILEDSLSTEDVLNLAIQIADALSAAHDHRIVHRDIKPDNVIITEDGYTKIIDFGLAKLLEAPTAPLSDVKTPMAP